MLLPRSSRDPIATNTAIDYVAQTTHTLVALVEGVLHELEETNYILRHGAHTTSPQAREGYAGHGDGEEDLHQARDDNDVGDSQSSPAVTRIIYPPSSASGAHPTPGPSITNAPSHEYPGALPTISTVGSAPTVPQVSPGPATSVNCAMLRREPCERDDLQAAVNALAAAAQGPSDDGDTGQDSHQRFTEGAIRAVQRRAGVGNQRLASTSQPGSSAQAELSHRSSLAPHRVLSGSFDESFPDGSLLANALSGAVGEGDLTRLQFSDTMIKDGPFIDRELFVRIGTRSQLGDFALFDAGLEDIIRACSARRFDITRLRLEFHRSLVSGGPFNDGDTLDIMTLSLKPFLRYVRTVSALFVNPDKVDLFGRAQKSVSDSFSHLHHLQLEGKTSAARLSSFPLGKLRILEILTSISEVDVQALPNLCRRLIVLEAGPVLPHGQRNYLGGASAVWTAFPPIMRIVSAFPCKELFANIPNEVALQFLLTNGNSLADVRGLFEGRPAWYLHLE